MASVSGTSISTSALSSSLKLTTQIPSNGMFRSSLMVSLPTNGRSFPSLRLRKSACFRVSCAAKQETLDKVRKIVKKQLALAPETVINGELKFVQLGADSLDTVEIVLGLEEEFGISVEEETAQSIVTIQDAADLVEKLIEQKNA